MQFILFKFMTARKQAQINTPLSHSPATKQEKERGRSAAAAALLRFLFSSWGLFFVRLVLSLAISGLDLSNSFCHIKKWGAK